MKLKTMTIKEVFAAAIKELERQCKAMEGMNFPQYMIERNEKQIKELKEMTGEFNFNVGQTIWNIRDRLSLYGLDDKYFIKCDTKEDTEKLAICLNKMGIKWRDGDEITPDNIIPVEFSNEKIYYGFNKDNRLYYQSESEVNLDGVTLIYFSELLEM